jgi:DNA-directed RNA polymerase subunit RPC12/RpoP
MDRYDCVRCWREARERSEARWESRIMQLCPSCGNKRCPKASDHRLGCTGSNEPGQQGSIYA